MSEEYTPFKMKGFPTIQGTSPAKQSIKDLYNKGKDLRSKGIEAVKNIGDKIVNTDIKDIPLVGIVPGSPPISYNDLRRTKNRIQRRITKPSQPESKGEEMTKEETQKMADETMNPKKKFSESIQQRDKVDKKRKPRKKVEAIKLPVKTPRLIDGRNPDTKKKTKKKKEESMTREEIDKMPKGA